MATISIVRSLHLGLRRHPARFLASVFLGYTALWTIVESVAHFFDPLAISGPIYYALLLLLSLFIGCVRSYQPLQVNVRIGSVDTEIVIRYGDFFGQDGYLAVPVNEYFDSELGEPVSPNSLHGMVIERFLGGQSVAFDQLIAESLAAASSVHTPRTRGREARYEIGTTAVAEIPPRRFLFFAFCRTDLDDLKAFADVPDLWRALGGLFQKARAVTAGEPLVLPLVGGGISGMGVPPTQLLQLIVLAIVEETKRREFCKRVTVVLHESKFEEIDLEAINRQWD